MKKTILKSLLFAVFCGFCAFASPAAVSLFSDYGQIQNVQNYSSNPFWTPNSPYNQRLPQPVYVQGADLNTEDCINIVQHYVSTECALRDNCRNTVLSDIRPTIMVALSNLPKHNYVSACGGYIDGIFESYVQQFGNNVPNRPVAFPTGVVPNPDVYNNTNSPQIENPYKTQTPQWQQEINERSRELNELQRQNGVGDEHISKTDFPATFADLSFSERTTIKSDDYAKYKDLNAYNGLNVKNESEWCASHTNSPECAAYKARQESATTASVQQNNNGNTHQIISAEEKAAIEAIVAFLNPQNQEEKRFFTDLATDFVPKAFVDDNLMLDDAFVYNFLADNDDADLSKYKPALINLSGTAQSDEVHIDLDWDDILIQISSLLDVTKTKRGALICENNRSYQVGIDTAFWIGTAAAAIASFGAGGVAAASGHAALGAGLKALAKGTTMVGLKSAGKAMSKAGSKQLAKSAVKIGLKQNMRGWVNYSGKGLAKRLAKQAGQNLITKRGLLLASGAVAGTIYETVGQQKIANNQKPQSKSFSSKAAGTLYSVVESEPSIEIINCQDLDYKEGCYTVCGHGTLTDDLNTKVFKPILGKTYCVNESDFTLYDSTTNEPLMMSSDEYIKVTSTIRSSVANKGKCDWNEDDIDMYFGAYIYDPDTLEPSSNMIIEEFIRIDD